MEYLVSMSTHQAGMSEYARRLFGEYSPEAHQKYQLGDVNTTLIHTLKGKTIMLQYDISTPRPYSRLIHCLRNGLPLDMDVYDAAEWSCITELSEKSVLNKSMAVEIPDFTRGAWKKYKY